MKKKIWLVPVAFMVGLFPPWLTANLLVYLSGGEKHDWQFVIAMTVFFFSFTATTRIIFRACSTNKQRQNL